MVKQEKLAKASSRKRDSEDNDILTGDRALLLDIANLRDEGWARFFRQWAPNLTKEEIYLLRGAVRGIWERKRSEQDVNTQLFEWLRWSTVNTPPQFHVFPWMPDVRAGKLLPMVRDIPARLAMAVLQHYPRLAKCGNPDCVVPYFIVKRQSQKFCERGECTRYAQNQYALKWWREKHGTQAQTTEGRKERVTRKTR